MVGVTCRRSWTHSEPPSAFARTSAARAGGSPIPAWVWSWLIAVLALALGVDLGRPTGWLGSDDAAYHAAAEHVLTGTPITRAHHHYARMAMVAPVTASVWLFGDGPWAVALPSVLAGAACVIIVALIGATVWGWWEGLFAATLLAVVPYFRVLSTTAYPDVHACFWCSAGMLAVLHCRGRSGAWGLLLALAAGFACAVAVSAKVTCAAILPIVLGLAGFERTVAARIAWRRAAGVVCGMIVLAVLEGAFHAKVTGDFWFSLRSLRATQGAVDLFATSELRRSAGLATFVWDRLTLALRPVDSGWGILGGAFWPVLLGSMWMDGRARVFAAWGALTYLIVAFLPVSSADGLQPMPLFHGRHVLTAVLPFALCSGRIAHRTMNALVSTWGCRRIRIRSQRRGDPHVLRDAPERSDGSTRFVERCWPAVMLVALGLFAVTRRDLNGFQDRDIRRVGTGIRALIAAGAFDRIGDIAMTPSMYWRFRILFPTALRDRLRVAVADGAPEWWRGTVPGIESRLLPSAGLRRAMLLATPRQLRGEAESWDYGCSLANGEVESGSGGRPVACATRRVDGTIALESGAPPVCENAVVVLLAAASVP